MSGRIVGEVLDNAPTDLTTSEFLVLISVAEDARDKDRLSRYSDLGNLTRRTRLAPGTIRNALSELTRRGLLTTPGKAHNGRHQVYTVADLFDAHRRATIRSVNGTERDAQ